MGILDDIQAVNANKPSRCPVALAQAALSEEESSALQSALEDPTVEHTVLTDVLRKNGFPVGEKAVGNHRRSLSLSDGSKCSCSNRRA